ncbi:hypothetical protein B0H12DRAFT_1076951 [Mycena haematopus]|nr:hypothetical protein B0H12DRAFT_1076951 [Mycena haematopus]
MEKLQARITGPEPGRSSGPGTYRFIIVGNVSSGIGAGPENWSQNKYRIPLMEVLEPAACRLASDVVRVNCGWQLMVSDSQTWERFGGTDPGVTQAFLNSNAFKDYDRPSRHLDLLVYGFQPSFNPLLRARPKRKEDKAYRGLQVASKSRAKEESDVTHQTNFSADKNAR